MPGRDKSRKNAGTVDPVELVEAHYSVGLSTPVGSTLVSCRKSIAILLQVLVSKTWWFGSFSIIGSQQQTFHDTGTATHVQELSIVRPRMLFLPRPVGTVGKSRTWLVVNQTHSPRDLMAQALRLHGQWPTRGVLGPRLVRHSSMLGCRTLSA